MVCRFICISNRHWMSCIIMTKCLTLRSRIGQGGDCWRWYWSRMHYLDVLTCFPWLDIASGCSVCEVTLVTRSDSCPVHFQSGQGFFSEFIKDWSRSLSRKNCQNIHYSGLKTLIILWIMQKKVYNRYLVMIQVFLGFATSINVLKYH